MLAARRVGLGSSLLVLCVVVVGCDNREMTGPLAVRQPKAPGGTYARPANSSTVHIQWDDSSANEIGFRVERSATPSGPWETAGITGKSVASFDDSGRASEQQVCYRVVTLSRTDESSPSNTSCTTPPAGPTSLTATALDHQAINLAWTDNSAVEDYYEVERATAEGGPYDVVALLAANTVRYRQSGLTTNTTYWYRVRVDKDGGYGDYSNAASAMPAFTSPKAPSGTNARPMSGSYVEITWVDSTTNESGFRVERSRDGGATWETARTLGPNATSAQDYAILVEQEACYRVFAFNAQGDSPSSDTDCTTPPAGPTSLTAVAASAGIDLTWTDNSAVEDGYEVWRYAGDGAGYRLVADLPASSTGYADVAASANITYWYYVRAKKDGGFSSTSNIANAVIATVPPNAPAGVDAAPAWSSTVVVITWTDNSTNEDGFRIERSTDGGGSWVAADTTDAYYGNYFYDDGRASEQPVCYRVIAFNAQGDSPPSGTDCTTPPAAATNLTATWVAEGVLLEWTDNSAVEDGYDVVLYTVCSEQSDYWIASLPANSTSYLLTDVSPWNWCGDYPVAYIVVTKDGGYGDFSNGASTAPSASATSMPARSAPRSPTRP